MTNPGVDRKAVLLFGCPIDSLTMRETVKVIERLIDEGRPSQHVVINAAKIVMMQNDDHLRGIVRGCYPVSVDGQPIVWLSRILGQKLPERVTGIDLFDQLLTLAQNRGFSVYFLGARPEVIETTVNVVRMKYPEIRVVGYHHGFFKNSEKRLIEDVAQAQPDILFVGMPSPQKEYWLSEHLQELNARFAMGVGGTFDVTAGVTARAPIWMQRYGLEWFFRFLQEPGRMWRRYLVGNTHFLVLCVREAVPVIRQRIVRKML